MPRRFRKITAALAGVAILSTSVLGTAIQPAVASPASSRGIQTEAKPSPVNPILKAQEADIIEFAKLLNAHRANHGLQPLKFNELASIEASNWSKTMGQSGYFNHSGPDEQDAENNRLSTRRSENIAKRYDFKPQELFWQWKSSPPHNLAMLSKTEDSFGIGFYRTTPADPNHKIDVLYGTTLFFRAVEDQLPKTYESPEDYFAGKPPVPTVNDSLLRIVPAPVTIASDFKSFTIPQQVGARYYDKVTQKFLKPGKHPIHNNTVYIVATEQEGYRFVTWSKVEWSAFRRPDTPKLSYTPQTPVYRTDDGKFGVIIPIDDRVDYYANGMLVEDGTLYVGPGPVTFTVEISAEYEQEFYVSGVYEPWDFDMVQRTEVTGIKPVTFERSKRTYVIPAVPNVDYLVNGKRRAPGKYTAAPGETVNVSVAPASAKYSIPNPDAYEQSYQFNLATVTATGHKVYTNSNKYTIPDLPNVQYLVDGKVRPPGTYPGIPGGRITMSARATQGYLLVGDSSWTYDFDYLRAYAAEPWFNDSDNTIHIPDVEGVDYYLNGVKTSPGAKTVENSTFTIVAKPWKDYVLSGTTSWTHTFVPELIVVQSMDPDSFEETGEYRIPQKSGIDYYVNGVKKLPGRYKSNFTMVKIEAKPRPGYKLWDTTYWELDHRKKFTTTTATAPTFNAAKNSVTIPTRTGVSYLINGKPAKTGVHTGHSGTGTVTAKASSSSHRLTGKTSWTFDNREVAKPRSPIFEAWKNAITIRATTGINYYIDGKLAKTGTHIRTGLGKVTDGPATGSYKTIGTTTWTFDHRDEVKPLSPTFDAAKNTITLKARTGINYYTDGKLAKTGTHKHAGQGTVTARAANGSYKTSGTTSWKFDNRNGVKPRVPVANKAKKTLTIGATSEIGYSVNGKSVAAGTYKQKPGTTRVTAKAANSTYKVSGTASWSFKF